MNVKNNIFLTSVCIRCVQMVKKCIFYYLFFGNDIKMVFCPYI